MKRVEESSRYCHNLIKIMGKHLFALLFLINVTLASAQQNEPTYLVDVNYEGEVYTTALTWDLKEVNLYADMYVPDTDQSSLSPLVVFVSDAYFTSTEASFEAWDNLARFVASCGFVVANIQYRQGMSPDLSNPLEDEFVKAMSRASKDVYSAIAYFREDAINGANYYNIDPDRVLLMGYSSGAMAALHAGKYYTDGRASTERLIRLIRQVGGWDDNIRKDELRRSIRAVVSLAGGVIDLNMYAPQDRTPVMLIQAENDSVIPAESGEMVVSGLPLGMVYGSAAIHAQMRGMQKRVERIVIEEADHTFNNFADFAEFGPIMVDFFIEALNKLPSGKNYERSNKRIITQEDLTRRTIIKFHIPDDWQQPVSLRVINGSNELVYQQNEVFDKDIIHIQDWLPATYTFKFTYGDVLKVVVHTISK